MSQKLTTKESLCVEYYCDPSSETYHNWSKSYQRAGYSIHKGWLRNAARVRSKSHIKADIEAKRAEYKVESSVSREYCVEKLQDIADNGTSERNKLTAISLLGDFCGFKRENAPNAEREAAKRARMTEEDEKLAEALAKVRTEEEASEPQIRPIRAQGAG